MAYETKTLLMSMAQYAIAKQSKMMYDYVAKVANVEGLILEPFEEVKETEKDE